MARENGAIAPKTVLPEPTSLEDRKEAASSAYNQFMEERQKMLDQAEVFAGMAQQMQGRMALLEEMIQERDTIAVE